MSSILRRFGWVASAMLLQAGLVYAQSDRQLAVFASPRPITVNEDVSTANVFATTAMAIGTTSPSSSTRLTIQHDIGTAALVFRDAGGTIRFRMGQESSYTGNYLDSKNIDLKLRSYAAGGTGGNIIFYTNSGDTWLESARMTETGGLIVAGTSYFGGEGSSRGVARLTIGAAPNDYGAMGYNFRPSDQTPGTFHYLRNDDPTSQLYFQNGQIRLRTAGLGATGSAIPYADALTIHNNGNVTVGQGLSNSAKLLVNGDGRVTGNLTVDGAVSSKFQDVAEWVPATEPLTAGTVVIVAPDNHVSASRTAYDTRVAGVVSARPGVILGEGDPSKALVATTGRVRVRVDATTAPIHAGDLLVTSDIPGTAMKSEPIRISGRSLHQPGTLIGKALESLGQGRGEILVLLSLQ